MKHTIINNMRLDLDKERMRPSISVKQGDTNTRVIHFTLQKSGKIYDLSEILAASVNITKPDGALCYNDCVIAGDEVQYTMTNQTINVCGECLCEVQMTHQDGSVITSPTFVIYVYNKVLKENVVESQNEYTALTRQVVQAKEFSEVAQACAQSAEHSRGEVDGMMGGFQSAAQELKQYQEETQELQQEVIAGSQEAVQAAAGASEAEANALRYAQDAQEMAVSAVTASENAAVAAGEADASRAEAAESVIQASQSAAVAASARDEADTHRTSAETAAELATQAATAAQQVYDDMQAHDYDQILTQINEEISSLRDEVDGRLAELEEEVQGIGFPHREENANV